jgi:hypothetical protein
MFAAAQRSPPFTLRCGREHNRCLGRRLLIMPEYNVALLDAFYGRVRLDHVHAAANANEAAVAAAKTRENDEQFAGGSTISSDLLNAVSGGRQHLPALPTTLRQP